MAKFPGFLGGTYLAPVQQADAEEAWNWYSENVESQQGQTKASYVMRSKPGFQAFCSVTGASSVRAECSLNNRGFAIFQTGASNVFYEIKADGSKVSYGTLPGDRRPQIVPGETQLLVLVAGLGYGFDLKANTLTRITAPAFPIGATKGGFLDGEYIVLEPNSQTFAISGLNDVMNWDPLDFGDVEGEPGNITTMVVDHRQIWFLGNNHGEIYVDSGTATFPFTRLDGAYMEQGAGDSVDGAFRCDNTIFWLGGNADGQGIIWRANGYTPQRISTHAIEKLIASFGDLSATTGYAYQEQGHTFPRWDFPNAYGGRGASLLYDVASGFWHRRGFWNGTLGQYMADLARTHMFVFGKHLVGDWRSGTIYEQSMSYKTDAGAAIRRLRASPDLANGGKFVFYGELRLLMDVGVGLDGPVPPSLPTGEMYFLDSPDFPTVGQNQHFTNGGASSETSPWLLASITAGPNSEATGTFSLSITANSVVHGPYPFTTDVSDTDVLVFNPPILVTSSDTWKITAADGGFGVITFNGSTDASLSGWQPPGNVTVTGSTPATMTLSIGAWTIEDGAIVPQPLPSDLSAAGVDFTNPPVSATLSFSDSFDSAGNQDESDGWITLSSGGTSTAIPADGVPAGDGTNPQMIMQRSNDGGKTWSSEQSVSMGKIGDYMRLAKWSQNGRSNNRSFRVICSEPVDASLVAADLDAVPGT
jgi:hypothetical protein